MGVFAEAEAAEEAEGSKPEQAAQILDMPPPWSERPDISREAFHARCYQGEKTIFYHKCKVEQYAPYTQDDGLVQESLCTRTCADKSLWRLGSASSTDVTSCMSASAALCRTRQWNALSLVGRLHRPQLLVVP